MTLIERIVKKVFPNKKMGKPSRTFVSRTSINRSRVYEPDVVVHNNIIPNLTTDMFNPLNPLSPISPLNPINIIAEHHHDHIVDHVAPCCDEPVSSYSDTNTEIYSSSCSDDDNTRRSYDYSSSSCDSSSYDSSSSFDSSSSCDSSCSCD